MAKYLVVAAWTASNKVDGVAEADTLKRAQDLVKIMNSEGHPNAFYVDHPGDGDWTVDPIAKTVSVSPHAPPLEDKKIADWLRDNPYLGAFIRAFNLPPTDPNRLEPNKALTEADLVKKIKANMR